jgi:acetoacetyl-CoA synthetase
VAGVRRLRGHGDEIVTRPLQIALPEDESTVVWRPPEDVSSTHLERWRDWLEDVHGLSFRTYEELWAWSVTDLRRFWTSIWTYFDVGTGVAENEALVGEEVEGAVWFPSASLNYAQQVLDRAPDDVAVIAASSSRPRIELTGPELHEQVRRAAAGLRALGVERGDRVAAYLPNIPETVVLMLASASLGAIFSSCAPEFGARAVLDRLQQIEPKVLVTIDGYVHRGYAVDRSEQIREIRAGLPSLVSTVLVPFLHVDATAPEGLSLWKDLLNEDAPLEPEMIPFDHPLVIVYSSGTTGLPKPIIHGHGGLLLEHIKLHHLHHDLRPGDRFFWYTTTGWVMWNYLVSGLLTGATIVLFDGDPTHPSSRVLWELAARESVTVFGSSAPFYLGCRMADRDPAAGIDLSSIRQVGSTGAPLPAEGYYWLRDHISRTAPIVSASGGTDVCTAFVAGTPLHPVVAGEITCRCLGVRVEAYDADGVAVIGHEGELVITAPMPSMPVGFWGDEDGSRYHDAYFGRFPGVWAHGDFIRISNRGSCVITGRSDATLNRGGVRLGTSDFYSVVEALPGVADSLVVHLEDPDGGAGRLYLFVQIVDGHQLGEELVTQIRRTIKDRLSPRHVPDYILAAPEVPRTLTGKKLEVPVKRILRGDRKETVASGGALRSAASLDFFEELGRSLDDLGA